VATFNDSAAKNFILLITMYDEEDYESVSVKDGLKLVISNELRVNIVKLLYNKGSLNLGTISANLKKPKQLVKHHISILESHGIVKRRIFGTLQVYELTDLGKEIIKLIILAESSKSITSHERRDSRSLVVVLISFLPLILSIVKLSIQKNSSPLWIVGGLIVSVLFYFVLVKIIPKKY